MGRSAGAHPMVLPFRKKRTIPSSSYEKERRARRLARLGLSLVALAVLASLVFFVARSRVLERILPERGVPKEKILETWEARDWTGLLALTASSLEIEPLEPYYLTFDGFASFYLAMELPEGEERASYADRAVIQLRKALSVGKGAFPRTQAEYVLGKAYFHKGPAYADLAVRYLLEAEASDYRAADADEYLALAYGQLGEARAALERFEAALARSRSETLLVAAAQARLDSGDADGAEPLLREAIASGRDALVREKARFALARILMDRKDYAGVESELQLLLAANPESAEAHYRLGLVHQERGDPVKARASWRRAVSLDPMHAASRQKLAEKL